MKERLEEIQNLERAFEKLLLEAIHFRNTGVGKEFLNKAIAAADHALSDWKQHRPTSMGLYECNKPSQRFNPVRERAAATRMRDKCVEVVRARAWGFRSNLTEDRDPRHDELVALADALEKVELNDE